MKFSMINILIYTALVFSSVTGRAVAKPTQDGKRFAVVDMQTVILNVTEGKSARKELETYIKDKEKTLLDKKKELDELNTQWKSQAAILSESARMKKQQEFQEKFMALRNEEMTFQQDVKRREQKATQSIASKVAALVNQLGKDRGFDMVFETNSAGLLYLKDPVDLTQEVIKIYEDAGKQSGNTAKK